MWKNHELLFNKKPRFEKLLTYGFKKRNNYFAFSADIMNNMFCIKITVTDTGITEIGVFDKSTGYEYVPAYIKNSVGAFVGEVRAECENILSDIASKCFEPDIFKSEYAKLVIRYEREKYGTEAEYLWDKFPNNAIFRESKSKKWYAALLSVEKKKIGIDKSGVIEIIDLKDTPDNVEQIIDGANYLPGYHMNKKHWYTIRLDGSVPIEEIYKRIDISFNTILKL